MVDRLLVERKLIKIETYLRELQNVQVKSLEEFKGNVVARRFIERQLELCVEQMIDVCKDDHSRPYRRRSRPCRGSTS